MTLTRRRMIALSAAFALAPQPARAVTWQGRAFGADIRIILTGPRQKTAAALAVLPGFLLRIESLFSLYEPGSALSRLNAQGRLARPAAEFLSLLHGADRAHRDTGGLFDPTVQPLWRARALGIETAPARAAIGWDRVRWSAEEVRLAPAQALTFNGIAQGFASDLARTLLADRGFEHALVNIGEHAALGGPFRLGLADPDHGILGSRTLTGNAIATSSPGALSLGNHSHLIGPAGERPLWSTLSVEAPSAMIADAVSTAAVFMSEEALAALVRQTDISRITAVTASGDLRSYTA